MNLSQLTLHAARLDPDRPAISQGRSVLWTYRAFERRVLGLSGALRRAAPGKGRRIMLAMRNHPAHWELLVAGWHAGFAMVPVNAKLHPRELAQVMEECEPALCFVTRDTETAVGEAARLSGEPVAVISCEGREYERMAQAEPVPDGPPAGPADPAWIFFTSGTTGRPKGAVLTHRNLMAMSFAYYADLAPLGSRDAMLHAAPLSHGSGLYGIPHLLRGANNVIPESGGFDPAEFVDLAAYWQRASTFLAPTMVNRIVARGVPEEARRNLSMVVYGGGPMYAADLLSALDAFGPCLAQIYGQGESPMTITALPREMHLRDGVPAPEAVLASVGRARLDTEVAVDCEGRYTNAPGWHGEVVVRGPTVMTGYWRRPEASAETLRDGWLRTGDVGSFDEAGLLTLRDRSKDVIITGGSNVYPREVEEVLLKHPAIREVSVVGVPDPDWGEAVVAAYSVHEGAGVDEAALDALCLSHIARFKRPKRYLRLRELPKNAYGKIVKKDLRALLGEGRPPIPPEDERPIRKEDSSP